MSSISKILSADVCNRMAERMAKIRAQQTANMMDAFFPGWKDRPIPADYVPYNYQPPSETPPDQCEGCQGERQEADEELSLYDDQWLCDECISTAEMER